MQSPDSLRRADQHKQSAGPQLLPEEEHIRLLELLLDMNYKYIYHLTFWHIDHSTTPTVSQTDPGKVCHILKGASSISDPGKVYHILKVFPLFRI